MEKFFNGKQPYGVMLRLGLTLAFYLLSGLLAFAREGLPVIHSNRKEIIIRYNASIINWSLTPEIKPDVFAIGSSLKRKSVQFVTDIDSISFDVKPGTHYDFIVMLNNLHPCYTRISALDDPLFLKGNFGIVALLCISFFLGWVYLKRQWVGTISLLRFGLFAPTLLHGSIK